jgi:alkanesulfonate monooxygenase SsuD/methylene tetrahydromethanopterin reductase-like flavin-dependent oxidoreductase (luciferase family)
MTVLGLIFRPSVSADLLPATVAAADAAGLDELWLWEDCFDHGGIAMAAAALARSERLRIGIGVLPVPLRNVALAAMEIATLHRMFPGRVDVGVGHGVLEWMAQVGARVESPLTLLREYVAALRALLDGETVTVHGRYVHLADVRLGWPPIAPAAIHVAGVRAKTVTVAGELGDGLVLSAGQSLDEVRAIRAIFDAARPAGAGPGRLTVYVELSDDADLMAAAVHGHADAGADAVILQPAEDGDPVACVRFLAEEVLPRVR